MARTAPIDTATEAATPIRGTRTVRPRTHRSVPPHHSTPRTIVVHPDADLTAQSVASRCVTELIERQSRTNPLHVAVTGGGLGLAIWPALAAHPALGAVDWTGVHLWFSDERFVPLDSPDRNDRAVLKVMSRLGLPPANLHRVPGPDTVRNVTAAAKAYAADLAAWADPTRDDVAAPWFALSILGIGPDGHVASLFPGQPTRRSGTVVPISDSPKPPAQRVSFTRRVLMRSDEVWFIAAGEPKAGAIGRALAGDDPACTPAAGLHGATRTYWFIDAALAQALWQRTGADCPCPDCDIPPRTDKEN